jgi:hypothetical protein
MDEMDQTADRKRKNESPTHDAIEVDPTELKGDNPLEESIQEGNDLGKHIYGKMEKFPISKLKHYISVPFPDEFYESILNRTGHDVRGVRGETANFGGSVQSTCDQSKPIKFGSHIQLTRSDQNPDL